ncbi:hypothetical protein KP509_19G028300 [Ceratopteris richardii]|nr:hypothetical protein KP509_19G028300 [Ceratopteris richardii]
MKYVKGDDEVRRYFAAFHLHEKIPTTVIIDDLVDLFDELESRECYRQARGWEIGIVRTLALCRDAMNYASQIAGVDCKLIISDTNINQGPRLLYIYQRWFTLILTVESIGSSFVLKVFQDSRCIPACKGILAQYTVSQQFLRLEMLR